MMKITMLSLMIVQQCTTGILILVLVIQPLVFSGVYGRSLVALLTEDSSSGHYHTFRNYGNKSSRGGDSGGGNDDELFSKTALMEKAIELNMIVQQHITRTTDSYQSEKDNKYHHERKLHTTVATTGGMNNDTITAATTTKNNNNNIITDTGSTAEAVIGGQDNDDGGNNFGNIIYYTEQRVEEICQLIENSFIVIDADDADGSSSSNSSSSSSSSNSDNSTGATSDPVRCVCSGTLHGTLSISCDYSESVCTTAVSSSIIATADTATTTTSTTRSSSSITEVSARSDINNTNNNTSTATSETESESETTVRITTCGKPQLGVTMVRGSVFSATTCIRDYNRRRTTTTRTLSSNTTGSSSSSSTDEFVSHDEYELLDTCLFVNACDDDLINDYNYNEPSQDPTEQEKEQVLLRFCDCTASYGNSICSSCTICEGGTSLKMDCTNIGTGESVSSVTECQPIDIDLDLSVDNSYSDTNSHNNGSGEDAVAEGDGNASFSSIGVGLNFGGSSSSSSSSSSNGNHHGQQSTGSFCSQLESKLQNSVTCDCHYLDGNDHNDNDHDDNDNDHDDNDNDHGDDNDHDDNDHDHDDRHRRMYIANHKNNNDAGGTFDITCTSNEIKCDSDQNNCGTVTSKIHVVNGTVVNALGASTSTSSTSSMIESCTRFNEPYGETCTTIEFCSTTNRGEGSNTAAAAAAAVSTNNNNSTDGFVCGCTASYNGIACTSCDPCKDGTGIELDCSNVYEHAKTGTGECQIVSHASSYEFIPRYTKQQQLPENETIHSTSDGSSLSSSSSSSSSMSRHSTDSYHISFFQNIARTAVLIGVATVIVFDL